MGAIQCMGRSKMADGKDNRPGARAWAAMKPYWGLINIYDGPRPFLESVESVPEWVRHLVTVHLSDSEVCNGGFHQFFHNSTSILAPEAIDGFRALGLDELAELVEVAMSNFGEPCPRDREARTSALDALRRPGEKRKDWDLFNKSDEQYYSAKHKLTFYKRADEFVQRHATRICLPSSGPVNSFALTPHQ